MTIEQLRMTLPSKSAMTLDEHENAVIKEIFESLKRDMLENRSYRYECVSDPEGDCAFLFKVDLLSCSRFYVTGAWDVPTIQIADFMARMKYRKWAELYLLEH